MESAFPECKELFTAYRRCFQNQSWSWGRAAGHVDDQCEDTFENLKACINSAIEGRQAGKQVQNKDAKQA